MKHTIEFDEKCKSCNGTGLYVGIGEHDGSAVVCRTCEGEGKHHFKHEYEDFNGREKRKDVERVFQANVGILIGKGKKGGYQLSDFGGMCYKDWLFGRPFEIGMEMRQFTCPCWWYQTADYKKKPDWEECWDSLGRSFSQCPYFFKKEECWKRWDVEHPKEENP